MKFILCCVLLWLPLLGISQNDRNVEDLKLLINNQVNDTTKVNSILDLSSLLFQSEPDSAIVYANRAILLAEEINFKKGLAYGYKNLGLAHYYKGEYTEVLLYWKKSLSIFEEIDSKLGVSNLLNNLGAVYQTKGDDPEALDYFIKSMRIAEQIKDSFRIGTAYLNIGTVYSNDENTYDQTIDAYIKAKEIFTKIGYDEGVGSAMINMAEIYHKKNEPKLALNQLAEAMKAYQKSGGNLSSTYNLMGVSYTQLGDFEKAEKYQLEAITSASEKDAKLEQTKAHIDLGKVLVKQKKFDEAITNLEKALELTEITGVFRDKKDAYDGLAEAYFGIKQYQKAYDFQRLYAAIGDTIRNDEYGESIGNLRFQFDLENKEKEIALLNKDNELKEVAIERSQTFKKFVFAVAVLLLAIIVGIFYQYRFTKISNARLAEERNKSENILLNILPKETAEELKKNGSIQTKEFKQVTVLFTDFKAFSVIAEQISGEKLVHSLDYYFKKFDNITSKHNLEKIKTIGDAYMCAGGLPTENDTHAFDTFKAALEILEFSDETLKNPPKDVHPFKIRIGINTGPVVAGVVGTKKFQYDIWGNTVNIASRMESSSLPGRINVSENTYQILKEEFDFMYRGVIEMKNEQRLKMYFAEVKKEVPV